jgi:hypothetical protein
MTRAIVYSAGLAVFVAGRYSHTPHSPTCPLTTSSNCDDAYCNCSPQMDQLPFSWSLGNYRPKRWPPPRMFLTYRLLSAISWTQRLLRHRRLLLQLMAHDGISNELRGCSRIGYSGCIRSDPVRREAEETAGLAGDFDNVVGNWSSPMCCHGSCGES